MGFFDTHAVADGVKRILAFLQGSGAYGLASGQIAVSFTTEESRGERSGTNQAHVVACSWFTREARGRVEKAAGVVAVAMVVSRLTSPDKMAVR